MKKLLLIVCGLILSMTFALADGASCKVRDTNGQVVLTNENAQSGSNSQVSTTLYYVGDKLNITHIRVIVKCFDAATDQVVGVQSVQVSTSGTLASACFNVPKVDAAYYFRLSDAHCR